IIKAIESKSQFVRTIEAIEAIGFANVCPDQTSQSNITFNDVSGLWIAWLSFFVIAIVTFIISLLLKRRGKFLRTPFDMEFRGKREEILKNELSANFTGNILISLEILSQQKVFLLENSQYCYEKMFLKPEVRNSIKLTLNSDAEMTKFFYLLTKTE